MGNSVNVLLCVIRAGLWGEAAANLNVFEASGTRECARADLNHSQGVDWGKVYQLAQEQSVQGLVLQGIDWLKKHNQDENQNPNDASTCLSQIKLEIPQVLLLQWIGEVQMIEQRNKEMNAFITELIEKLQKNGIYALLVKGQGIAQCHEKPLWRCSGDVDLLLDNENYHRAKDLLITNASNVEKEVVDELHIGMTIDGWVVELHGTLHSELSLNVDKQIDQIQEAVFKERRIRLWRSGDTDIFLPAPDEDVLFVFTHILQHFYKGGIGLRQICDWCRLLWTYRDEIDVRLLEQRIKRMGLISEWKAFGAFAVEYLGMPLDAMPFYSAGQRWKKKAVKICSFILEVGNFGHNRDNSYFQKHSYFVQKCISAWRRVKDLCRHARIFPLNSFRFFFGIMFNGVRSAVRGE